MGALILLSEWAEFLLPWAMMQGYEIILKWHPIGLKYNKLWAFDNNKTIRVWVKNLLVQSTGPGVISKRNGFLKMVDFLKVAQEGYLKSLSPLLNS